MKPKRDLLAEIKDREAYRLRDADSIDDTEFLTRKARETRERLFAPKPRQLLVPMGMDEWLDGPRAQLVDDEGKRRPC